MAPTRARLNPGLAKRLAAGPIRDKVESITDAIVREAKDRAPDAKTWITEADERVRPSHAHADGQTIAENLSYELPAMVYQRKGRGPDGKAINPEGGWQTTDGVDLASAPRDPELPLHQRVECRCESVPAGPLLAEATHALPTRIDGTRVEASVECTFHRVGEAEFGNQRDHGTHFLGGAGDAVAARYRGAR